MKRRDIRLRRELALTPERGYALLTSATELTRWWLQAAETDPRNLGRVRLRWPAGLARAPSGWLAEGRGVFVDLEPARKVAWAWDRRGLPPGVPPLTSVFLEPSGAGTRVTILHAGFPASAARVMAACRALWSDCLARLAAAS